MNVICVWCVVFREYGVIVIDYGYLMVNIVDLSEVECIVLFDKVRSGNSNVEE